LLCRPRKERNLDDAVAGFSLIVASSFRVFYSKELMMKRVSKRDMEFRFGLLEEVKVAIDRIEPGHAVAIVAGVACRLDLLRDERLDLGTVGALKAHVSSYRNHHGDGWLPKGTRHSQDPIDAFNRSAWKRGVWLHSQGLDREGESERYATFEKQHPVGSMIEAAVVRVKGNYVRLRFDEGLCTRIAVWNSVDRWPDCRRMDMREFRWPNRVELIVRRVAPQRHVIQVSLHGFPRDDDYCNAAAGYRSGYDASAGLFQEMPWHRPQKM
jgi:hypothetical protein